MQIRGEIMSDFVIKDTVFTDMSVKRAEEALSNVSLKTLLTGYDEKYRFYKRDSYYLDVTDADVMFENVVYPIYESGNENINLQMLDAIDDMIDNGDAAQLFQVYDYVISEQLMKRKFPSLPFVVFDSGRIKRLVQKTNDMELELKQYRGKMYASDNNTFWDRVQRTIKRNSIFSSSIN